MLAQAESLAKTSGNVELQAIDVYKSDKMARMLNCPNAPAFLLIKDGEVRFRTDTTAVGRDTALAEVAEAVKNL
jgi:hypothetical protein